MIRRLARLLGYARPHARGVAAILLLMTATIGLDVLKPWPMQLVIDHVIPGRPLPPGAAVASRLPGAESPAGLLAWLSAATVIFFLCAWVARVGQRYLEAGVGARMSYDLAVDLFYHLQRLSLRFHRRQMPGDLVKRVTTDSGCARELVMNFLLPLSTSAVTLGAMLALLWRIDRQIAAAAAVVAPAIGFVVWRFARVLERTSYDQSVAQAEVMSAAEQTLTALPVVRAFARESYEDDRFRARWRDADRHYLRNVLAQAGFKSAVDLTMAAGVACVLGLGGWHVLHGRLTVGTLVVALSYLSAFYAPIETIAYISQSFASAAAGARRVFEILDADDAVREAHDAVALPRSSQAVEVRFEEVTFGYAPGKPVLRGVNLAARAGETVALVGASGAGKSTLVSLIPRLADPWNGRVLIDGRDVHKLTLASLRDQVAIVLQESLLLPVSVAENIRYGRPHATRREVELAAVAASAHDFISRLPNGYDTVLAERGATLSGGERQRIAIARALIKNAPVVILDEPTASLDAHTEAAIFQALARLTEGRTTFVIAHRLSTVRRADRILVIDDGRIAEEGTHEELLARGGLYRSLSVAQGMGAPA